jgi:hypothetical protein
VIIDDLYVPGVSPLPDKANPKPIIDPDAVLALAVSPQGFQTVTRRALQVMERGRSIQHPKFSQSRLLNHCRDCFDRGQIKQPFGFFALK